MCYVVDLPSGSEAGSINELESAFHYPVNGFYPWPETLNEEVVPGQEGVKDCCLCHVDLEGYLTHVGATWHYYEDWGGDIHVIMMPPLEYNPPFPHETENPTL